MIQRIISGIIILVYVAGGYLTGGSDAALRALGFCILPFFAIWFPGPMGAWTGTRIGGPSITKESPGCLIQLLGWVLLFVPLLVYLIVEYGV